MKNRIEEIHQEMDRYYEGYQKGYITEREYVELVRPLDYELDRLLVRSLENIFEETGTSAQSTIY